MHCTEYLVGTRHHINAWHNLLSLSNCFCIGSQFESRANCPISSGIKIQHFVFVVYEALIIYVGASPVHNIRRHVTNLAIRQLIICVSPPGGSRRTNQPTSNLLGHRRVRHDICLQFCTSRFNLFRKIPQKHVKLANQPTSNLLGHSHHGVKYRAPYGADNKEAEEEMKEGSCWRLAWGVFHKRNIFHQWQNCCRLRKDVAYENTKKKKYLIRMTLKC